VAPATGAKPVGFIDRSGAKKRTAVPEVSAR
jgi:hypothetical protein